MISEPGLAKTHLVIIACQPGDLTAHGLCKLAYDTADRAGRGGDQDGLAPARTSDPVERKMCGQPIDTQYAAITGQWRCRFGEMRQYVGWSGDSIMLPAKPAIDMTADRNISMAGLNDKTDGQRPHNTAERNRRGIVRTFVDPAALGWVDGKIQIADAELAVADGLLRRLVDREIARLRNADRPPDQQYPTVCGQRNHRINPQPRRNRGRGPQGRARPRGTGSVRHPAC